MPAMAVSVPKRLFKKAVDRNLLKRRIREAYRLNKKVLTLPAGSRNLQISIFILYLAVNKESFQQVENGLVSALKQLAGILSKDFPIK